MLLLGQWHNFQVCVSIKVSSVRYRVSQEIQCIWQSRYMGGLAVSNNSTQQIRLRICFVQSTVSNLFALDVDVFCLMPAQGRLGIPKEVLLILKTGFHQHS